MMGTADSWARAIRWRLTRVVANRLAGVGCGMEAPSGPWYTLIKASGLECQGTDAGDPEGGTIPLCRRIIERCPPSSRTPRLSIAELPPNQSVGWVT
jgi:hypothetical protein